MGRAFEFRKARKMKRWSKMAKTFTRIGKDIVIAVKEGGASPETNSRLRQIMQNAKAANMPKDNVLRAIKKASSKETANYEEISLEGYAANGIAIFVDCATNNNNRTVADVRSYFSKCDGALGTNGSLEFIFNRKGVFTIFANNTEGYKTKKEAREYLKELKSKNDYKNVKGVGDYWKIGAVQYDIKVLNAKELKEYMEKFDYYSTRIA